MLLVAVSLAAACRLDADRRGPDSDHAPMRAIDPLIHAVPAAVYHREKLAAEDNAYAHWREAVRHFEALTGADDEPMLELAPALGDWGGAVRDLREALQLGTLLAEGDAELIGFCSASSVPVPNAPRR
jgi:hypothetical protein